MSRKLTVAIISDLHCGSTLGLCPPKGIFLDDGNPVTLNKGQKWAWSCFEDFISQVKSTKRGGDLFTVFNGDMIDGDHHGTAQLITKNLLTQSEIARECIDPLAGISDRMFMVRGTPCHVGESSTSEEALASDFNMEKEGIRSSFYRLVANFRGVKFDVAHHTTMSGLPWNKNNAANRIASKALFLYAASKRVLPNFVVRSHVHQYADSGRNFPVVGIVTPSWQLSTEYVYKINPDATSDLGGLIFVIEDGKTTFWHPIIYTPEGETVWEERSTSPAGKLLNLFGKSTKSLAPSASPEI